MYLENKAFSKKRKEKVSFARGFYMEMRRKGMTLGVSTIPYMVYSCIPQAILRLWYACIRICIVVLRNLDGIGQVCIWP